MTEDDLDAWRSSAVTKEVFRYMQDYSDQLAKIQATTDFGRKSSDEVARMQAQTYGMCFALEDIINIKIKDISDFYDVEKEEENEEVQQTGSTPD